MTRSALRRGPPLPRWVVSVAACCASGCAALHPTPPAAGTSPHLPAFSQVDEGLYRGGQPTPEGFRQLSRMGIKTVICLRQSSRRMDEERREVEGLGMRWINIPMWYWWRPSEAQIRQFLDIATDPAQRPVFVHCRQGRNRAGIMAAVYRIACQGWAPRRAYAEGCRLGLAPWNPLTRSLLFRKTVPRSSMRSRDQALAFSL
ncbi:MAG: protein tyrosine phosphatase family protein [Candidatus Omnitrophica bacterium]|nr:protein tyrosine phosphatase family protein [Candidatus Omnitrophota bacterium]